LKLLEPKINVFIAVSKSTKRLLVKNAGISDQKVVILYNFVDFEAYASVLEAREEKKKDRPFTIGYAGRLSRVKGCEYLIKSLPFLDFSYCVVIAGDGVLKNELIDQSNSLGVSKNITFLGYVKDLKDFYSAIDVLVVPSLMESFGLSAVEAQSAGVPVIASDVDGLKEVIDDGKNGLLFEVKNFMELAEKISAIRNNDQLRLALVKESSISVNEFGSERYLGGLSNCYNKIML
jgi:glycosyltransferase involved in cell wall biosynthesis